MGGERSKMKFNLKEECKEFKELSLIKKFHVIIKILTFILTFIACIFFYINKMYLLGIIFTFFVIWDIYNFYKAYKIYLIESEIK